MISNVLSVIRKGGIPFMLMLLSAFVAMHALSYYVMLLFFAGCAMVLVNEIKRIDMMTLLLILFGYLFAMGFWRTGLVSSPIILMVQIVGPFIFYVLGRHLVSRMKSESEVMVMLLLVAVAMEMFIVINVVYDIFISGNLVLLSRKMDAIIGGEPIKATLAGLSVSPALVGWCMVLLFSKPMRKPIVWVGIVMALFALLSVVHFVNRTGLVLIVVSNAAVIGYLSRDRWMRTIAWSVAILSLIILVVYATGFLDSQLAQAYLFREERKGENEAGGAGGRSVRWVDAIEKLIDYPYGWATDRSTFHDFVHNLWLDVARLSGIFPFLIIVFSTLGTLFCLFKIVLLKKRNILIGMLVALHTIYFFGCFVEPVTEGYPFMLFSYCFLWAVTFELYDRWTRDETFIQDLDNLTPETTTTHEE